MLTGIYIYIYIYKLLSLCAFHSQRNERRKHQNSDINGIENSSNLTNLYHNTTNVSIIRKCRGTPKPLLLHCPLGSLDCSTGSPLSCSSSSKIYYKWFSKEKKKPKPKLCSVSLSLRGLFLNSICYGFFNLLRFPYVTYVGVDFGFCFQKKVLVLAKNHSTL